MSANVQAPELKVRFSKRDEKNGGEQEEVDIYENEDTLEQSPPDPRPHEVRPLTQTRPAAVKRRPFGATAAILGVMYLLIFAGLYMRNIFVTLEKQNLTTERDQLKISLKQSETRYDNLSRGYCHSQETENQTQGNITEWKIFQCSCYYKSTEMKNWTESQRDCQNRGADLVAITSKEEQDFVNKLNKADASWIGLRPTRRGFKGWLWGWVDGSSPISPYMNWKRGVSVVPVRGSMSTVYVDPEGRWGHTNNGSKRWICEKRIYRV